MKRVNEAPEERKRERKEAKARSREGEKARCSSGSHVALILTKCPHLCLINTHVHSHVHPHAHFYKTIITSPGKLMDRQIKN